MKEAAGCFICLLLISGFVCEHERMHMLVIYMEYPGLFMFSLEVLNIQKRHSQIWFAQFGLRTTISVAHFQNQILPWYITLWNVNIDGRWEQSSWMSDLNLLSSLSNLQETFCCHVTVFTVCWQKCHFQRPILIILSEQAGDSLPNLWQQGLCDVFRRFRRMMCEYLCLSR